MNLLVVYVNNNNDDKIIKESISSLKRLTNFNIRNIILDNCKTFSNIDFLYSFLNSIKENYNNEDFIIILNSGCIVNRLDDLLSNDYTYIDVFGIESEDSFKIISKKCFNKLIKSIENKSFIDKFSKIKASPFFILDLIVNNLNLNINKISFDNKILINTFSTIYKNWAPKKFSELNEHNFVNFRAFSKNLKEDEQFKNMALDQMKLYNSVYEIPNEDTIEIDKIKEIFKNKTIAVVGNATPKEDLSKEIDNHDIVIRLNHFYNYKTNKVGKKLDILAITPTIRFELLDPFERNDDIILKYQPVVFVIRRGFRMESNKNTSKLFEKSEKLYLEKYISEEASNATTGTQLLQILNDYFEEKIDCYCFSQDEEFAFYIKNDCFFHEEHADEENKIRKKTLNQLCKR